MSTDTDIVAHQTQNKWTQALKPRLASLSLHERKTLAIVSDLLLDGKTDKQVMRLLGWDRSTAYRYASTARLMWASGYQHVETKAQQAMELRALDAQLAEDLAAYHVPDGEGVLPHKGAAYLSLIQTRLKVKAQLAKLLALDTAPVQTHGASGSVRVEDLSDEALDAELDALEAVEMEVLDV